jgi:hypothetical protein
MLSVHAIFDGKNLKLLNDVKISKPKKVIITFLEDEDLTTEELQYIAEKSGSFDFLEEEPELYGDEDLKVKY